MLAIAVQEYIVLFAGLDCHVAAVVEPELQFLDGPSGDGYQPLLRPLAEHAYILFVEIEVRQFQVHQFADAQSTGEQHLDDGTVPVPLPFREIDAGLQTVDLLGRQHLGQMFPDLR